MVHNTLGHHRFPSYTNVIDVYGCQLPWGLLHIHQTITARDHLYMSIKKEYTWKSKACSLLSKLNVPFEFILFVAKRFSREVCGAFINNTYWELNHMLFVYQNGEGWKAATTTTTTTPFKFVHNSKSIVLFEQIHVFQKWMSGENYGVFIYSFCCSHASSDLILMLHHFFILYPDNAILWWVKIVYQLTTSMFYKITTFPKWKVNNQCGWLFV